MKKLFPLLLLVSAHGWAGSLWLNNGDKLSGELVQILDGELVWRSPILGELTISQLQVAFMSTRSGYHVMLGSNLRLRHCALQRREQQQWLSCEGAERRLKTWQGLSQVVTDEFVDKTAYDFSGSVTIALEDSGGNTEEVEVGADIRSQLRNDKNRHSLAIDVDIKESDGEQTKDEQTYRYKYDRFVTEQWYWTGNAGYEKDDFKEMEVRKTAGAGLGYQVIDTDFVVLDLEGGLNYIVEEFEGGADNEKGALRLTTDFEWQLRDNGLSFFHRNLLWQTFESGDDWELETETGFLLPILGRLSSELKLEYDYDNLPAEEDEQVDRVWTMGVRYDW